MKSQNRLIQLFLPNKISLENLKGDFFGGLTTGVVAIPLALAFGVASGLPEGAQAGLYSAIILGFVAALFAGTAPQVSGPTGPMTVVAAGFIATSPNPEFIFAAVVLGGLFQIAFGILGLGHYIRYVPQSVITGFMTGIGVIIFTIQIQPIFGLKSVSGPVQAISGLPEAIRGMNVEALLLGAATIALIYLVPFITKAIPATLIALLLTTLATEYFDLNVMKIGTLPSGLPSLSFFLPDAQSLPHVLLAAITLAILGSLDSLLGSVVVDNVTNTKHNSDKELVGQGMGNALSGLFGGLPGAGATMRTLLNIRTGGKTALSGMIHSILLAGVLLGLSRYASLIPLPVLAGILVTVGIGIVDFKALKMLPRTPRTDRIVFILVLALTVLVDLITAVQMGFLVGCILFMKNLSDKELTRSGSLESMVVDEGDAVRLAEQVRVIQAEGPIFFGTSESFTNAMQDDLHNTRAIIIRMSKVPLIDQTGAFALKDFVVNLKKEHNITVVLSGLPEEPLQTLYNLQVIPDHIPENTVYPTLADAVNGLNDLLVTQPSETLRPQSYLHKVGG